MKSFSKIVEQSESIKYYKIIGEVELNIEANNQGEATYMAESVFASIENKSNYQIKDIKITENNISKFLKSMSSDLHPNDKIVQAWADHFQGKIPTEQEKMEFYHHMRDNGFDGLVIFDALKDFIDINEGVKNIIPIMMTLISLGCLPKNVNAEDPKVKTEISKLSKKDTASLDIIEKVNNYKKYVDVDKKFNSLKKDTIFDNTSFPDFIKYVNNSKTLPIKVNIFLIDIPEVMLHSVPLYGLEIGNNKFKIDINSSTLNKDIYLDSKINKYIDIYFMSNPLYTRAGIKYNF